MSLFSKTRIGITIQDNTLMLCENTTNSSGDTEINGLNIMTIPHKVIQNGRIVKKKTLKNILLKALETAKPNPIKSTEIVFEIPEEYTFQHTFSLPANLNELEVKQAVVFQAEKLLPFELNQVSWDIKIIPQDEESNMILFTAVPFEFIQEYYDVFMSCGLMPLGFSIRAEDLIQALGKSSAQPTVIMDLQNKYTSVLLFRNKTLISLEQINIGEDSLINAIADKFSLPKRHRKKELQSLSGVDIGMASIELMKKLKEEFLGIMKNFEKLNQSMCEQEKSTEEDESVPKPEPELKPEKEQKKQNILSSITSWWEKNKEQTPLSIQLSGKSIDKKIQSETMKKKSSQDLPPQDSIPFEFIFTGYGMFHSLFQEAFGINFHPKLSPLKTNLKHIINLKKCDQNRIAYWSQNYHNDTLTKLLPSVIGASLTDNAIRQQGEKPINLLPPMVRSIALWKETSVWFYASSLIILLMSVGWLMAFGFTWGQSSAELKISRTNFIMIERQYKTKNEQNLDVKIQEANQELQVIRTLQASKNPYSDIIQTIQESIPAQTTFNSLQYGLNQDKTLFEWNATAEKREDVIATYEVIKGLPFIEKVFFPPSNLDPKNLIQFSILFKIKDKIKLNST